ncbi:MAG: serine hydrolase [Solirubrobacteraceae bacterium]|nr:serine hydrolase [Solirubrobacteraceae bacterium]
MRSFLILHGWQGSGPGHWQTWLAERLAAAGETVRYPDLPDPDEPDASQWADSIHAELEALTGERTVVCHSLACLLWAREAARIAESGPVDRLLLVAPPCPVTPIPGVHALYPTPLDPAAMAASAREARVVGSDRDPYCPAGPERSFARPLELPIDILEGAGHINTDAGYGPWPAVEAWCLHGTALA